MGCRDYYQHAQMPTELTLYYTTYSTITVPNKIARKMKEAQRDPDNAQSFDPKKPWTFGNKWGNIFYTDDDGVEHEIKGLLDDCDFKRAETCEWDDEQEEEDEDEDDCVIPSCCTGVGGCSQCCSEEDEDEGEEKDEEPWEEIYNKTGDMPGEPRDYSGQPGTFYQTYGNGGGPGGSGGYWVREGGRAVWMVKGNNFSFIAGAILEVISNGAGFQRCRLRILIK